MFVIPLPSPVITPPTFKDSEIFTEPLKDVIHLDIFHIHEGSSTIPHLDRMKLLLEEQGKVLFHVHTNLSNEEDVFYDFLWNRQKCAFTDFEGYGLKNTQYFGESTNNMFELTEIKKGGELKKFLSPNRTSISIQKMIEFLKESV